MAVGQVCSCEVDCWEACVLAQDLVVKGETLGDGGG